MGGISGSASAQPIAFDCDTPAGSFSEIVIPLSGTQYWIKGAVTPIKLRSHESFLPAATLLLRAKDNSDSLTVQIVKEGDGIVLKAFTGKIQKIINLAKVDQKISFEIVASPMGKARVTMAGIAINYDAKLGSNAILEVRCSTGEFKFNGLDWRAPSKSRPVPVR